MNDQRSTEPARARARVPVPRAAAHRRGARARRPSWSAREPWGREQWERLAERPHVRRHGVVAAVARRPTSTSSLDLLPADAQVVLVEPTRLRDRAADILAEEADLGRHAGQDVGRRRRGRRRVPQPARAVRPPARAHRRAGVDGHRPRPTARASRRSRRSAGTRSSATATASIEPAREPAPAGLPRSSSAPTAKARRTRTPALLRRARPRRPSSRSPPLERGFILPAIKLAVLAEADLTGRRRAHRAAARPQAPRRGGVLRRPQARRLRRAPPARRRAVRRHGEARHRRRRARLPAARVPRRRQALRPVRPDRRRPPLHRRRHADALSELGGGDWPKTKARVKADGPRDRAGARGALPDARAHARATRSRADTPWQHELEDAFPYEETPDQLQGHRRREGRHGAAAADGSPASCGDVGFGKTEVAIRAAFKAVQDGKQVAVLVPTTLLAQQHVQTFGERFAGYPVRVEVLSPLPHAGPGQEGRRRASPTARSTSSSAPTACCPRTSSSRTSGCSSSTRSSASA